MMLVQPISRFVVDSWLRCAAPRTLSGLVISASAFSMMMGAPIWGAWPIVGPERGLMFCLVASGLLFIPQGLAKTVPICLASVWLVGFLPAASAGSAVVDRANAPVRTPRGHFSAFRFR